jgi:hypothetical protein
MIHLDKFQDLVYDLLILDYDSKHRMKRKDG